MTVVDLYTIREENKGVAAPKPTCQCGTCKKCKQREYARRYRLADPERWRALKNADYQRHADKRRKEQAEYRAANLEAARAATRESMRKGGGSYVAPPEKTQARTVLNNAVTRGILSPQPCEKCGESPVLHDGRRGVQAHHDDYSKPLEVRWLCVACHGDHHRRYPR